MNDDLFWKIALFLALLCGVMAIKQSHIPSFVGQEVMRVIVSNDRYRHDDAPTSVIGKRGKTVEEESLAP